MAPATAVPRPAERPHARRLRRARSRCSGIVAHHLKPGMWFKDARRRSATARSGGSRRRWTSSCSRAWPSRTASAASRAGSTATAMDWFLERARALGVEHAPPAPLAAGPPPARRSASTPGPRMGAILKQVYERQLDGEVTTLDEALAHGKGDDGGERAVKENVAKSTSPKAMLARGQANPRASISVSSARGWGPARTE